MKPKMNIFKQYFYAMTNPKKYGEMTKLGGGRIFLYLLILSLISTVCFAVPIVTTYFNIGNISDVIDSYVPDFSFENGNFETDLKIAKSYDFESMVEEFEDAEIDSLTDDDLIEEIQSIMIFTFAETFSNIDINTDYSDAEMQALKNEITQQLQDESFYLYLDTSVDSVISLVKDEIIDLEDIKEENVILITKTDYSVMDKQDKLLAIETEEITSYTYGDNTEFEIEKTDIIDVIKSIMPVVYIIFAIVLVFMLFINIIGWLITSLFFAVLALIANALTHKHFKFGTLFKVAVYAHTTTIILDIILSFVPALPFVLNFLIGLVLPMVYIVLAILYMEDVPVNPYNNMYYNNNQYNNPYNNNQYNNPYNNNNQYNNPYNNQYNNQFDNNQTNNNQNINQNQNYTDTNNNSSDNNNDDKDNWINPNNPA